MRRLGPAPWIFGGLCLLHTGDVFAATVPADVFAVTGQPLAGINDDVTDVWRPFVEGDSTLAFSGEDAGGMSFAWRDGEVLWYEADAGLEVTGASQVSTAPGGAFVLRSVAGNLLLTHNGVIAQNGVLAPGLPGGGLAASPFGPLMQTDGGVWWTYILNSGRYVMRSANGLGTDAQVVLAAGTPVGDGWVVDDASDALLRFHISPSGGHHVQFMEVDDGSVIAGDWIWVDGALVAGQFEPTGSGGTWFTFEQATVADDGQWALSGRLTGGAPGNEVVFVDGSLVVANGDTVGGITLPDAAEAYAVSLDGTGRVAHTWRDAPDDVVLVTCDVDEPVASTRVVVQTGDELDTDGDQVGDITVEGVFHPMLANTRFFAADGSLLLNLETDQGRAIVRLGPACCDGGACCGNGVLDPGEVCDDGDADNSDSCTVECAEPYCGDGLLHPSTEACDDGNRIDDDACSNACVAAPGADGSGGSSGAGDGDGDGDGDPDAGQDTEAGDGEPDDDGPDDDGPGDASDAGVDDTGPGEGGPDDDGGPDGGGPDGGGPDGGGPDDDGSDDDGSSGATAGSSGAASEAGCSVGGSGPARWTAAWLLLPLILRRRLRAAR